MATESKRSISTKALLPYDALAELAEPKEFRIGYRLQPPSERTFVIGANANPLRQLIVDASTGQRVYELLSIERPGDLLAYVRVRFLDSNSSEAKHTFERYKTENKNKYLDPLGESCEMAFAGFDACFPLQGDDTEAYAQMWRDFVNTAEWREFPTQLLRSVRIAQAVLNQSDDYLVKHEIGLKASGQHYLDFPPTVRRFGWWQTEVPIAHDVPPELFDLIVKNAERPDVRSVSCPFQDYWLWRELVGEQVRRSIEQGVPPQDALRLNGPDGGIPLVSNYGRRPDLEWGGEIHIPYEGACDGDLFIQPKWFGFTFEQTRNDPPLRHPEFGNYFRVGQKLCKHLLTPSHNLGDIVAATRTVVGDWVLYSVREDAT